MSRLLRATADRLEPPRRPITQPGFAPLVRIGGRWWRREELQPLAIVESVVRDGVP
jgi:hypothetical protein